MKYRYIIVDLESAIPRGTNDYCDVDEILGKEGISIVDCKTGRWIYDVDERHFEVEIDHA